MLRTLAAFFLAAPLCAQSTTFPNLVYANVLVAGVPTNLLLDLVVPTGPGPWPLVVWVHGGGWSGGSRLPIPGQVTRLVPRGYAVASIDYRLSGQAIWPAQIQDCKAAIRYLRANAGTFGLDGNRIGVMGSSAGGHLVAALLTMGGTGSVRSGSFVVDLEGTVGPHVGTSARVQCALPLFGPTNMLFANDFPTFNHDSATSPESRLIGGALQANPEKWATVDPIPFLGPDDGPLFVMHGTDDTSVPFHQSELLVRAAEVIGHDVTFFPVQDNGHGGPGFSSATANAATDAFFDRTLRDLPDVVVGVTPTDGSANENGDGAVFTVVRSGPTLAPVLVRLWPDGLATVGEDFDPLPLLVTIPAGQSSVAVALTPRQDGLVEGPETVVLHVAASDTYRIDHAAIAATATVADDESDVGLPVVTVQGLDAAATEAPGDTGAVEFVRSGPVTSPVTVAYEQRGSAAGGLDFAPLSGSVVIPIGAVAATVVVAPLQDTAREPGETVVFVVSPSGSYARGAAHSAHVVIADDDRSLPQPVVNVSATDRGPGEPSMGGAFTVTRTGATTASLSVSLAIGGTSTSGIDHAPLATTVVVPAGAAWVRIPVAVLDDGAIEGPESLDIGIVPTASYVLGGAPVQRLWLGDDEAPPPAPSAVPMALGPLAVGRTGVVTITGASPAGVAGLWFGLRPAYQPLPPFGTVLFDLTLGGLLVSGTTDAAGTAVLAIALPHEPSLAGIECWWQGIATVAASPFLLLTDVAVRTIGGSPQF